MIKKALAVLFLCAGMTYAVEPNTVNRSSHVAGTNHEGYIASKFLDKVLIGVTTSGGSLEIYSSTWQKVGLISSMTLTAGNDKDFQNLAVDGIYYKASTPTNGVTIIYKR